ncbi:hypothetical protein HZA57_01315 [Candidatus Poribacteria bacterium]|nr:hypothetical protein [Candidatus Poribacteria bacterium]
MVQVIEMARKDPGAITTEVMLNIINAYETFTPRFVSADLQELSIRSARVRTGSLTKKDCESLMETKLLAKITLGSSFLPKPLTIKADIFWAKWIVGDRNEQPYADLGFNLRTPTEKEELVALKLIVERFGRKPPGETE